MRKLQLHIDAHKLPNGAVYCEIAGANNSAHGFLRIDAPDFRSLAAILLDCAARWPDRLQVTIAHDIDDAKCQEHGWELPCELCNIDGIPPDVARSTKPSDEIIGGDNATK